MARIPSIEMIQSVANIPPSMKLAQSGANSRAAQMARAVANSHSVTRAQVLANGHAVEKAQALANNRVAQMARALANSHSVTRAQVLANGRAVEKAQALANSRVAQMAGAVANSRVAQCQSLVEGLSATDKLGGFAEIARRMQNQPALALSIAAKANALQTAIDEINSVEDYDPIAIEKLIDGLFDLLEQVAEKIEFRSVVMFLFPIVLTLYLYQISSMQVEEAREENRQDHMEIVDGIGEHANKSREREFRILDRLEKLEKKIDELSVAKNAIDGTFYVVIRPAPLNVERRYHGAFVSWLHIGQEVELIEKAGKWIRVSAYKSTTGTTQTGWVIKKYLRRLQ